MKKIMLGLGVWMSLSLRWYQVMRASAKHISTHTRFMSKVAFLSTSDTFVIHGLSSVCSSMSTNKQFRSRVKRDKLNRTKQVFTLTRLAALGALQAVEFGG